MRRGFCRLQAIVRSRTAVKLLHELKLQKKEEERRKKEEQKRREEDRKRKEEERKKKEEDEKWIREQELRRREREKRRKEELEKKAKVILFAMNMLLGLVFVFCCCFVLCCFVLSFAITSLTPLLNRFL